MHSVEPFDIDAEQIERLGARFTPFINKLLEVSASDFRIAGYQLALNSKENIPDGGVDATIRGSPPGADFIPAGDSAWQFKRGNPGPKACADELEAADWAHELLESGGAYVLVVGPPLPDNLIEARRRSIAGKAVKLGLIDQDDPDRIRVYEANRLARWASRFPALAMSRVAGGPGSAAIDFERWESSRAHTTEWVADGDRTSALAAIREQVESLGAVEVRVQGESGIGKTRLVLEALRKPELSPLVAYVHDSQALDGELLTHLIDGKRSAVLVVDECPAERHVKLVERLPTDPGIKLVTIGDAGLAASRGAVLRVGAFPGETTEEFLKRNFAALSREARRFVADHSRGNPRWTIVLAERVAKTPGAQAAQLIARNDIEQFVANLLPEGRDFFCSAVLALFERVGWDGGLRYQAELLADFAGVTMDELSSAATQLSQRGLLTNLGRYRSVTPHPLAVYLAAEGWRELADRLVDDLLPRLDEKMAFAFFRRVADLGRFEPARSVLPRLLAEGGPFSSLEAIEANGVGRALTQLAIVMPEQIAVHLHELLEEADLEVLRDQRGSRRDLVWTLEKLAWHSETFATAAHSLLRLALAENETYANNATGTWVDLFKTMLPGTSAAPSTRVEHLRQVATSDDAAVRLLAIQAAAAALSHGEMTTVSGELQGGVLVEPRGIPKTYGEAGDYRNEMISLLTTLARDEEPAVADAAETALIESVTPLIGNPFSGGALEAAVLELGPTALRRLRARAEHLLSLYERRDKEKEDHPVRERLTELLDRLPTPEPAEEVRILSQLQRWDFGEGELQRRMHEAVGAVGPNERQSLAQEDLAAPLPAAWELGNALAQVDNERSLLPDLVAVFPVNPEALLGYLVGLEGAGPEAAFDQFLDSELAAGLPLRDHVALAVRGAVTDRARARIMTGIAQLPVNEAVSAIFGWHRNLTEADIITVVRDWARRVESQRDYNALVDWLNFVLHREGVIPEAMRDDVWTVLAMRTQYPSTAHEGWDWSQLAKSFVDDRGVELGRLIVGLIDDHEAMIHESDEEANLLGQCAAKAPELWQYIADRLLNGSWRLEITLRGWFLAHVPADHVNAWIAGDVTKARIVASIAPVGGDEPSPYARYLLEHFGDDNRVAGNLYGDLISGSWVGSESDRIAGQIERLQRWRENTALPSGVRKWARKVIVGLERSRKDALRREAEESFD